MADPNDINDWIKNELNNGTNPEVVRSKLKEYGYDPNIMDPFIVKSAVNSNPPQYQNTGNKQNQKYRLQPSQNNSQETSGQATPNNPDATNEFQKMGFIDKAKMILLNPKGFFDIMPRSGGYGDPYRYYLLVYVISTILSFGITYSELSKAPLVVQEYLPFILIVLFIFGLVGPFISAAFLNLLFKLFGGKGTYESTLRVICYVATISLLSWIPIIGGLIGLYGLYIAIIGYSKVHQISGWRVLAALIVPFIIILVLVLLAVYFAYSWIASMQSAVAIDIDNELMRSSIDSEYSGLGVTGNLLKMALS